MLKSVMLAIGIHGLKQLPRIASIDVKCRLRSDEFPPEKRRMPYCDASILGYVNEKVLGGA